MIYIFQKLLYLPAVEGGGDSGLINTNLNLIMKGIYRKVTACCKKGMSHDNIII